MDLSAPLLQAQAQAERRLRPWLGSLPATDIFEELRDAVRLLRAQFPCVASALDGTTVSVDDLAWIMEAAGTIAVMKTLTGAAMLLAGGASSIATPDFKATFVPPTPQQRDELAANLAQAVGYISCVRAGRTAIAASVNVFGVAGRRRSIQAAQMTTYNGFGAYGWLGGLIPGGWWGAGGGIW